MIFFSGFTEATRKKAVIDLLLKQSHTNLSYFVLLSVSSLVVALGLSLDNVSVVIGGMLIAPFLTPILSLGLGITVNSVVTVLRSFQGIITSIFIVLLWSFIVSSLVHNQDNYLTTEILSRGQLSLMYFIIAFLSGLGATYAWVDPSLAASLPGVSVAVALVPPLSVTGIALAQANRELMFASFNLFAVNVAGIVLASIIIFALFNFGKFKQFTEKKVEEEVKSEGV